MSFPEALVRRLCPPVRGLTRLDHPLGVIFTAGLGIVSTADLGVISTAGLGVISTAGLGVIFTAGLGVIVTSWRLGLIRPYKAF